MRGLSRRARLLNVGGCDASNGCPQTNNPCCSVSGFCGNGTDYCGSGNCAAYCPSGVPPAAFNFPSPPPYSPPLLPSSPPPPPLGTPSSPHLSGGIVAIIVIGVVFVVALCLFLAFWVWQRWRRRINEPLVKNPYTKSLERPSTPPSQQGCVCYALSVIKEATHDFDPRLMLGEGGCAVVYKGAGIQYENWAIKKSKKKTDKRAFEEEVNLIRSLNHRHVVALLGWCSEDDEEILIYEYVANGDLYRWLHGQGRKIPTLSFEQRVRIALGSAQGLAYIHEDAREPLVHRDVKSLNILLTLTLEAKVADFGISSSWQATTPATPTRGISGTHGYLDPDYIKTRIVEPKLDVFSFGVVLLELVTGREPRSVKKQGKEEIVELLYDAARPAIMSKQVRSIVDRRLGNHFPLEAMTEFAELAAKCVSIDASSRPDMKRVVVELDQILSSLQGRGENGDRSGRVSRAGSDYGGFSTRASESTLATNSTLDFDPR
eukprot:TRINITY_DN13227_c0_g1_i1.p1 TRINITY_DN13227_c0_g1~~TRINITY_DN13227_c0_g1_i1.p1  ORF type:complete len:489 (+),score=54.57 TRINITY_DN13227_c0_g1_i1:274-1740(+)